jgi:hypothetical protein
MEVELLDLRDHPLPFFDGAAPARTLRVGAENSSGPLTCGFARAAVMA